MSGEKPSSGSLHYTNSVLDGGYLVIGDYKVTFNQDGKIDKTEKNTGSSSNNQSGGNNQQQNVESLEIGDSVNYSTTLNGVTLNNWKVFYVEGDYTYLIYGDYLPNVAISESIKSVYDENSETNIDILETYGTYSIFTNNSREDLISAMTTKSNWDDLVTNGQINSTSINFQAGENVWAMGAPTIDLWVNSWNTKYPSDTLYIVYSDNIHNNGYDGYYISDSKFPDDNESFDVDLSNKTGYNNILYFPHQESIDNYSANGYWLASPSAGADNHLMSIDSSGWVSYNYRSDDYCYYSTQFYAFRPVIKLPTSILNQ